MTPRGAGPEDLLRRPSDLADHPNIRETDQKVTGVEPRQRPEPDRETEGLINA